MIFVSQSCTIRILVTKKLDLFNLFFQGTESKEMKDARAGQKFGRSDTDPTNGSQGMSHDRELESTDGSYGDQDALFDVSVDRNSGQRESGLPGEGRRWAGATQDGRDMDVEDDVPEDPLLAETHYSQFADFESLSSDEVNGGRGTDQRKISFLSTK